jgi:hypothetical protein
VVVEYKCLSGGHRTRIPLCQQPNLGSRYNKTHVGGIPTYKPKLNQDGTLAVSLIAERQFKHKKTGVIGKVLHDGHLHFERCAGNVCALESLHMSFVEDSKDWEELNVSLVEDDIEQKMLMHFNGKRGSFLNRRLIHEIAKWMEEKQAVSLVEENDLNTYLQSRERILSSQANDSEAPIQHQLEARNKLAEVRQTIKYIKENL